MSRLTRAMLLTLVTGAIMFGAMLALGAPVWAAFGVAGILAEIRQSRVLDHPPEELSAANRARQILGVPLR